MPIGPPSVLTVGDAKASAAFPFARFTVTGPTVSTGAGPPTPRRRFTVKRPIQSCRQAVSTPSSVSTVQV